MNRRRACVHVYMCGDLMDRRGADAHAGNQCTALEEQTAVHRGKCIIPPLYIFGKDHAGWKLQMLGLQLRGCGDVDAKRPNDALGVVARLWGRAGEVESIRLKLVFGCQHRARRA